MSPTLVEAIVALDEALDAAALPHAFGGALALAWCTGEPRATRDIDCNVFIPPDEAGRLLAALPPGISHDATTRARLGRDGQDRLWWGRIPVDLFLSTTPYHDAVRHTVVRHPFAGRDVPFLGCQALATFKACFDRPKDWLDLDEMLQSRRIDPAVLHDDLVGLLSPDDPRLGRLADLVGKTRETDDPTT